MEPYAKFTNPITKGARGKRIGALFDLDGTLIGTHSVKDIFIERLRARQVSASEIFDTLSMAINYRRQSGDFTQVLESSISNLQGQAEADLVDVCDQTFKKRLAPQIYPELKAIVRAHKAKGHTVAIISSATRYQIDGIARSLGIENILCTELQVKDGKFTGEIDGEACYGQGKVRAAKRLAKKYQLDLKKSYFYSDGIEDVPLLEAVGNPVAVNPDKRLLDYAGDKDWPIHKLDSRGSAGIGDMARTLLTFGSVLPAVGLTKPLKAIGANDRDAINFSIGTWANLASAIARIKLLVSGEEHLWSHRPAVIIFNHQSAIDTLIMAKLLRQDFVGVAKKEIQNQPFMGPALKAAGAVFVDRDSGADPREMLKPAVEALHNGLSVILAPEGTRSKDEKLGAFKKGAFFLALQAKVPIVPIVIHNALDALPNGSMVVRPAEIKVTVLKPIPTSNWTLKTMLRQVKQVRNSYLHTLGQLDETAGKQPLSQIKKHKTRRKPTILHKSRHPKKKSARGD